jgi:beta-lactamase superfamily II metal-dependent hydrolase
VLYYDETDSASGKIEIKVSSLSPSDAAIINSNLTFTKLAAEVGKSRERISSPSPNHVAVVLWVEVGNHKFLLGADLEQTNDPGTGWIVIINESTIMSGMAEVFKVPHHGSISAHNDHIWTEALVDKPITIMSSFIKGRQRLPTQDDI